MLVLLRHGQATANASGLLLGRTDVPLTTRGKVEARALGGQLDRIDRIISSPLLRARETASALDLDLEVEIDARWIEVDYGEHEGRPISEVPAEVWQQWRTNREFQPAHGESLAAVASRVQEVCEELFALDGLGARATRDVVVVSHVSPIKAAVAWALGAADGLDWRLRLSTGSITRIDWGHDGPVLVGFNECPKHPPIE